MLADDTSAMDALNIYLLGKLTATIIVAIAVFFFDKPRRTKAKHSRAEVKKMFDKIK